MLRNIAQPAFRNIRNATRSYHAPAEYKGAHMDDLPVPSGPWKAYYNEQQKKYNLVLASGVVSFIGTLLFGVQTDLIFLNWAPPSLKK